MQHDSYQPDQRTEALENHSPQPRGKPLVERDMETVGIEPTQASRQLLSGAPPCRGQIAMRHEAIPLRRNRGGHRELDPESTFTVYRFWSHTGRLLYVGITGTGMRRMGRHRREREWWPEVARIDLAHYPTRAEALKVEWRAIENERPAYNIVHAAGDYGRARSLGGEPC